MLNRARGCRLACVAGTNRSFDLLEPRTLLSGDYLRFDLAAQAGTNAVVAADFDRNGIMDLAAANADAGSVSVILNKEGKFQSTDNYTTGGTPYELGIFDFNRDTFPDLITLDRQNAKIITIQNNGDGTFGSGPEIDLPEGAHAVRVGDFNHDERMDLAVLMPAENAVRIYLLGEGDENGPPALGEYASYGVGNGASFLEMGDVNSDGVLDLVTTNTDDDTVTVLTGVAGTPSNGDWLHDVFTRLIHREPNTGELDSWLSDLDSGAKERIDIVSEIAGSDEFLRMAMDRAYTRLFDLMPDQAARDVMQDTWGFTGEWNDWFAHMATSDGFVAHHGHGNETWFNAAFPRLVGRQPGVTERVQYMSMFDDQSTQLIDVCRAIMDSDAYVESSLRRVYFDILRQQPDQGQFDTLAAIYDEQGEGSVIARLLGSDDFFNQSASSDGSFAQMGVYDVGDQPGSVRIDRAGDDHNMDLVVTNAGSGNVTILTGNDAHDSFAPTFTIDAGNQPSSSFGFFEPGNGYVLAVANRGDDTVSAFKIKLDATVVLFDVVKVGDQPAWVVPGWFGKANGMAVANQGDGTVTVILFGEGGDQNNNDGSNDDIAVPGAPDLADISDTGDDHQDNITRYNNAGRPLKFIVGDVPQGAFVNIFADGIFLGNALSRDDTGFVEIWTDGFTVLRDGEHEVRASLTINGREGDKGEALVITVRTPKVEADQSGSGNVITRGDDGAPIVRRRGDDGQYQDFNLHDLTGGPDITGDVVTMDEPKNEQYYAAGQSDDGVVLYTEDGDGGWRNRNLTQEVPGAEPFAGADMDVYTTPWGYVNIVGVNAEGEPIMYWQDGQTDESGDYRWNCTNIGETELQANDQPVPDWTSDIESYVTPWGGLNVAGIDSNGHVFVVWWSPASNGWISSDLTSLTGTLGMVGSLSTFVTEWGGITITGLDEQGHMIALWWAPGTDWQYTDMTTYLGAADFEQGSQFSFVTDDSKLIITGLSKEGTVMFFKWTLENQTWEYTSLSLPDTETSPIVGALSGYEGDDGTLHVVASNLDGQALDWSNNPSVDNTWAFSNLG